MERTIKIPLSDNREKQLQTVAKRIGSDPQTVFEIALIMGSDRRLEQALTQIEKMTQQEIEDCKKRKDRPELALQSGQWTEDEIFPNAKKGKQ